MKGGVHHEGAERRHKGEREEGLECRRSPLEFIYAGPQARRIVKNDRDFRPKTQEASLTLQIERRFFFVIWCQHSQLDVTRQIQRIVFGPTRSPPPSTGGPLKADKGTPQERLRLFMKSERMKLEGNTGFSVPDEVWTLGTAPD